MGLKERMFLTFSVLGLMSTFNVGSCEQRHRFVNPHLKDNNFQLQKLMVFIWSGLEVLIRPFV